MKRSRIAEARCRHALDALDAHNDDPAGTESETYLDLNDAARAALNATPWWVRWGWLRPRRRS